MKAKLIKQTEKAVQLNYNCEIYGEILTVKSVWFPKSQIEIISIENDIIEFNLKNDWILNLKTKEYCSYLKENGYSVKSEINTEKIISVQRTCPTTLQTRLC